MCICLPNTTPMGEHMNGMMSCMTGCSPEEVQNATRLMESVNNLFCQGSVSGEGAGGGAGVGMLFFFFSRGMINLVHNMITNALSSFGAGGDGRILSAQFCRFCCCWEGGRGWDSWWAFDGFSYGLGGFGGLKKWV